MKNWKRLLFETLALLALQIALAGCVAEVGGGYHDRGPWFHDGPWMDGGPRGGVNIDVHPPGFRR